MTVPWTWRHRFALACGIAYLTVQVAVPLSLLAAARPARFGWQMWTVRVTFPRFFVIMQDGTRTPADLPKYVAASRGEIDLRDALPPHLCGIVAGIAAVDVQSPGSASSSIYPCR